MTTDERLATLEQKVEALEARISKNFPPETVGEIIATNERVVEVQVGQLAALLAITDQPQLFFAATPFSVTNMDSIFESASQTTRLFENPVIVRENGFGLSSADRRSAIVDGHAREVKTGTQARRLSRDGQLVVIFRGDDDFLGWGMKSTGWPMTPEQEASPWRINSLVLVESIYGCARLATDVLKLASPPVDFIQYSIGLRNMKRNGQGPKILNGKADRSLHSYPQVQSDFDDRNISLLPLPEEKPERAAFRLVAEIYRLFGIPDDRVPYTQMVGEQREIIPAQF